MADFCEKYANDNQSQLGSGRVPALHPEELAALLLDDFGGVVEAAAAFGLDTKTGVGAARTGRTAAGGGANVGLANQVAATHYHRESNTR
jgi:hypothetical protein